MNRPETFEFKHSDSVNTGWLHTPSAIGVIAGFAILSAMVATFLYACLQMPGSVQPVAVGKGSLVIVPQRPREVAACPAKDDAKAILTVVANTCQCLCGERCDCSWAGPLSVATTKGQRLAQCKCAAECCQAKLPPPEPEPLPPACPCSDACKPEDSLIPGPVTYSEIASSPPKCKLQKRCRPRVRFFRRRCH